MEINEVKIGDTVSFKHKGKTMKGKIIHLHDYKNSNASLAGHVNVQGTGDSSYPVTIHAAKLTPVPSLKEETFMDNLTENIENLIDHIHADENVEAKNAFDALMQHKINELLNNVKVEVAQDMFNTNECAECEAEEVDEALVGKQHKIDANKNGKIDAHDFKLFRKKKGVKEEVEDLDELSKQTLSAYIKKAGPQIAGLRQKHGLTGKPAMKRSRGVTRASINYLKKDLKAHAATMAAVKKEEVAHEAYSDPYAAKKSAEMKKAHAATMADAKKEYDAARKPKFAKNFMKMNKEEVNLQELDADTLRSISKQAKPGQLDAARKGNSTAKKQVKGISNANSSLTKKYKSKLDVAYNNGAAASYNKAKPGTYHGD